jgi:crotonobetainyl-CoA:carnitine CoA-transferase CaiB-like acyl-CoA transferase
MARDAGLLAERFRPGAMAEIGLGPDDALRQHLRI